MKKFLFLILLLARPFHSPFMHAQNVKNYYPPTSISVEEMVGDQRQFLQLIVSKDLSANKKTGLLSFTSYSAPYKSHSGNNEFQNTTLIHQHLFSGIGIQSGVSFIPTEGIKNFIGLQYFYQNKALTLIYLPSYYLKNNHKISNMALLEYQPVITKNWSLYTRVQMLYSHSQHSENPTKSYVYSRLGVTHKSISFGLAHNLDRQGAHSTIQNNYGLFIKI